VSTTAHRGRLTLEELRERPVVDVPTAGAALGLSRSASYRMAASGHLPTIKLGDRRVVVPTARLLALLEGEGSAA
jgi:predicted DNA-binding transcriptional regulator AlpA